MTWVKSIRCSARTQHIDNECWPDAKEVRVDASCWIFAIRFQRKDIWVGSSAHCSVLSRHRHVSRHRLCLGLWRPQFTNQTHQTMDNAQISGNDYIFSKVWEVGVSDNTCIVIGFLIAMASLSRYMFSSLTSQKANQPSVRSAVQLSSTLYCW